MSTNDASYRKNNDSRTYHKKYGTPTPTRSTLKREAEAEIKEELSASNCLNKAMKWVVRLGRPAR